jgi:protocatechuate 3,4-dioxygenase alpha subunit
MAKQPATPSQTIGPFFSAGLARPEWSDLTGGADVGERIVVGGRVLDGDGVPVPDAMLEIWQADPQVRYPDAEHRRADAGGFRGFGRALTDRQGEYRFTTVKPGRVPGRTGGLQAPHLDVSVFARGLLRHLSTRIYFADEPSNETDAVLGAIADPAARRTLVAAGQGGSQGSAVYRFDIVLQGENETAFFDI